MENQQKQVSRPFVERTTMHGLLDIAEATTTIAKISWSVVLLLALVATVIEVYMTIQNYIESPILTTFSIEDVTEINMPQIYICPNSPVDNRKVLHKDHYDYINQFLSGPNSTGASGILSNRRANSELSFSHGGGGLPPTPCNCTSESNFKENHDNSSQNNQHCTCPPTVPPPPTMPPIEPMERPTDIWQLISDYVGFTVDEVLGECSFRNTKKNCSFVSEIIFDINYGRCILLSTNETQVSPGKGWSMVISAKGNDKISSLMMGVAITLLEEYNPVDAANNKFFASANTYTKVSITATKLHQISVDTGKKKQTCIENEKRKRELEFVALPYSRSSCKLDCSQKETNQTFGCLLPFDRRTIKEKLWSNVCTFNEYLEVMDYFGENKSFNTKQGSCAMSCHPLCDTWKYEYSVTASVIDTRFTKTLSDLGSGRTLLDDFKNWPTEFVVLDLSFADLQIANIIQDKSMTIDTMISNIGGQYGLWLGGSILSLVQIVGAVSYWIYEKMRKPQIEQTQIKEYHENQLSNIELIHSAKSENRLKICTNVEDRASKNIKN